jgi:hypothetical protein
LNRKLSCVLVHSFIYFKACFAALITSP